MTLDAFKQCVADLARPLAIIMTALATAAASVILAMRVQNFTLEGAAIFMGALHAGVAALYGAKAWEIAKTQQQVAEVEKAKVAAPAPTPKTETVLDIVEAKP